MLAFYEEEHGLGGVHTEARAHRQLWWLLLWDQIMDPCVSGGFWCGWCKPMAMTTTTLTDGTTPSLQTHPRPTPIIDHDRLLPLPRLRGHPLRALPLPAALGHRPRAPVRVSRYTCMLLSLVVGFGWIEQGGKNDSTIPSPLQCHTYNCTYITPFLRRPGSTSGGRRPSRGGSAR